MIQILPRNCPFFNGNCPCLLIMRNTVASCSRLREIPLILCVFFAKSVLDFSVFVRKSCVLFRKKPWFCVSFRIICSHACCLKCVFFRVLSCFFSFLCVFFAFFCVFSCIFCVFLRFLRFFPLRFFLNNWGSSKCKRHFLLKE